MRNPEHLLVLTVLGLLLEHVLAKVEGCDYQETRLVLVSQVVGVAELEHELAQALLLCASTVLQRDVEHLKRRGLYQLVVECL